MFVRVSFVGCRSMLSKPDTGVIFHSELLSEDVQVAFVVN